MFQFFSATRGEKVFFFFFAPPTRENNNFFSKTEVIYVYCRPVAVLRSGGGGSPSFRAEGGDVIFSHYFIGGLLYSRGSSLKPAASKFLYSNFFTFFFLRGSDFLPKGFDTFLVLVFPGWETKPKRRTAASQDYGTR